MRSTYWDSIKGLAIIAVVIIHACLSSYNSFPEGSANWVFGMFLCQIVNFAVPIFFALAGLFCRPKANVTPSSFISSRCLRLIPPYLLWTLAYIILSKPSHFQDPQLLLVDIFQGKGVGGIGYFVIVLLQFILLAPLIWKIRTIKTHIIVMISFSAIGLFATYILRTIFIDSSFGKFPLSDIFFIYWYPFFHFGVFTSMYREVVDRWVYRAKKVIIFLVPLVFLLTLLEGFFWSYRGFISLGASQVKASSFTLSFMIFLLLLRFQNQAVFFDTRLVAWLGRGSYVIYLSHNFALVRVETLLSKSGFIFQMQPLFIFLGTSITLALCAFLILLIEKSPMQKIKQYIGI